MTPDGYLRAARRHIREMFRRSLAPDEIAAARERLLDSFAWDGDGQLVDHGRWGAHNDEVRRQLRELPRL